MVLRPGKEVQADFGQCKELGGGGEAECCMVRQRKADQTREETRTSLQHQGQLLTPVPGLVSLHGILLALL